MPSIRLTGDIAHIREGTRAQAADLNLTLAEDGFPVAVTIRKGPLEVLTEAESERLDDFLKKSGAQARCTRDGMTAYEIESQRIFFETAQAMDTP